jgi:hypothetical protein
VAYQDFNISHRVGEDPKNIIFSLKISLFHFLKKIFDFDYTCATNINQCHVWIVNATIISSVIIRAVKLIATTWIRSESKVYNAPYIIVAPKNSFLILHNNNNKKLISKIFNQQENMIKEGGNRLR